MFFWLGLISFFTAPWWLTTLMFIMFGFELKRRWHAL